MEKTLSKRNYPLVTEDDSYGIVSNFPDQETSGFIVPIKRQGAIYLYHLERNNWLYLAPNGNTLYNSLSSFEIVGFPEEQQFKKKAIRKRSHFDNSFLQSAIEKATYIYKPPYDKDNWDEAGSKGYTKETLDKSIHFLHQYAKWVFEHLKQNILPPKIFPGRDGGIDFLWKNGNVNLLMRVDKDVSKISYSAQDKSFCISEGNDIPLFSTENTINYNIFSKIIPPIE